MARTFKVNVKANVESTKRNSIFYDLKPNTVTRLRIMPPVDESGMIFSVAKNHFKLKDESGKGIALACLNEHAENADDNPCYLCKLIKFLNDTGDKSDAKIARDLTPTTRHYVQAFIAEKQDDGTLKYIGPRLVGLSKSTAEQVSGLMTSMAAMDLPLFCDPEQGQDLGIKREGSGFDTKYQVTQTSIIVSLDKAIPGWEDKIITDVYKELNLKILSPEEQRKTVMATFGDALDWDAIDEALGS